MFCEFSQSWKIFPPVKVTFRVFRKSHQASVLPACEQNWKATAGNGPARLGTLLSPNQLHRFGLPGVAQCEVTW